MIIALYIILGIIGYTLIGGIVQYFLCKSDRGNTDTTGFAWLWPLTVFFLLPLIGFSEFFDLVAKKDPIARIANFIDRKVSSAKITYKNKGY